MEKFVKTPITSSLRGLKLGDVIAFDITRIQTIKQIIHREQLQTKKRFSAHVNKDKSTVDVTRVA